MLERMLEKGGSVDARDIIREGLGRDAEIDALVEEL